MQFHIVLAALLSAYILGSVPVGLLVVKLVRGRDIRQWFSGRTGGTNVMRMAGFWAGYSGYCKRSASRISRTSFDRWEHVGGDGGRTVGRVGS